MQISSTGKFIAMFLLFLSWFFFLLFLSWRKCMYTFIWITYCIRHIFHAQKYNFGLSGEIRESLISRFSDVFISINRHILKWKCSHGLTRKIRENKTTAKITTYTVLIYCPIRARRTLMLFNVVPFRTKRVLWLYKVYDINTLLVLKRTLWNSINTLLVLNFSADSANMNLPEVWSCECVQY